MSRPEQAATVTPGQAAHLAWHRKQTELAGADPDAFDAPGAAEWWYGMSDTSREVWEAAAQAAIDRKPGSERVAELVTEVNELRARLLALADHWNREYASETGWPSHCAAELREALHGQPAVVTAGTEHLAAQIRELAIGGEDQP